MRKQDLSQGMTLKKKTTISREKRKRGKELACGNRKGSLLSAEKKKHRSRGKGGGCTGESRLRKVQPAGVTGQNRRKTSVEEKEDIIIQRRKNTA